MSRSDKAMCVMGALTLVLAIACGIFIDLGLNGTAWACGCMAVVCFLMALSISRTVRL